MKSKLANLKFNKNFKFQISNSAEGFTLIELLVVIIVIFAVGSVISAILYSSFRGATKTNTIDFVRRNGDYAITQMSRTIRYAKSLDGVSQDGIAYTTCDGRPLTAVPASYSIAKSPQEGLQTFLANIILKFENLGKKEASSLFSKLALLIPKFGSPSQSPRQEVAGATSDPPSSATGALVTTLTWSHTVGSGSNRLLLVGISFYSGPTTTINRVTYGGVDLFKKGEVMSTGNDRSDIWYTVAPPTGTNNIVVTFSNPSDVVAGATSWAGVDQTTPLGTFASATGSSTTPSVTVTSATGEVVQDNLAGGAVGTSTVGIGQTQQWNTVTNERGAASTQPGASTVRMSWTLSSSNVWAIGGVSIKPAAVPTSTPTPTTSPAGLVGYWKLDEVSGTTAADSSGTGNTGTVNGIWTPTWTTGKYRGALNFDGVSGHYVNIPGTASLNFTGPFTLSGWVKPTVLPNGVQPVLIKTLNSGNSFTLSINTNSTAFFSMTGNGCNLNASTTTALTAGSWAYLAAIYDGANLKIYLNGILQNTTPFSCAPPSMPTSPLQFADSSVDSWWGQYNGVLDEVRAYNYAISQAQILTDMNDGVPPTATPTSTPTPTPLPPPTPTPIPYHFVRVTGSDGGQTIFHCDTSVIASNSASLIQSTLVKIDSCVITCAQNGISSPPTIGINLNLSSNLGSSLFEKQASIPFQTSVTVRNY